MKTDALLDALHQREASSRQHGFYRGCLRPPYRKANRHNKSRTDLEARKMRQRSLHQHSSRYGKCRPAQGAGCPPSPPINEDCELRGRYYRRMFRLTDDDQNLQGKTHGMHQPSVSKRFYRVLAGLPVDMSVIRLHPVRRWRSPGGHRRHV
ncbi:MAG: hypothetical protein R3C68_02175 [Myxococcota bacterium]